MAATNYFERIPAAIARGKELFKWGDKAFVARWRPGKNVALTAGEVALAEALWIEFGDDIMGDPGTCAKPLEALIAFTEKIERLVQGAPGEVQP